MQAYVHRCQAVCWSGVGARPGCPQTTPERGEAGKGWLCSRLTLLQGPHPRLCMLGLTVTLPGYTDTSATLGCAWQPWWEVAF